MEEPSADQANLLTLLAVAPENKNTECYLGLLYAMEDVAVYGYVTPLKVKIVVAFALSDSVVRDIEVNTVCCPFTPALARAKEQHTDLQSAAHGVLPRHLESLLEARQRDRALE